MGKQPRRREEPERVLITARKTATQSANDTSVDAEAILEMVPQPLLVLDAKLRIQWANPAFYELCEVSPREAEGKLLYDIGGREWDIPAVHTLLKEVLSKSLEVSGYEVQLEFRRTGSRRMLLNPRRLVQRGSRDGLILLAIEDITKRGEAEIAIHANERQQKDLIEALPSAVYTTDAEGWITSYNPAAAELWGRSPELGKERWCGSWRSYRPDGTPLPHEEGPMAIALKEKRSIRGVELEVERPDGVRVPFLGYPTLLRDAMGRVTGAVNMLVDITGRKQADEVSKRLAAIVESSDDAILSKTPTGIITSWNAGAERLFGYRFAEIVGKSVMILVPPERHDEEKDILSRVRRGEHIQHYETIRQRKDGTGVWVSLTVSPLSDEDRNVVGASTIARDMTERRRADAHRKTLMHELNHRVKNTMAVIQSIATQTLGHASTLDQARDAFIARLINLANAYDMLTRESWHSANLTEIVADAVKPHAGEANRFRIEGPEIWLSPNAALAVAMTLHELCTNAVKYGALSNDAGQVLIAWQIEGEGPQRRFSLHWEERGGPAVARPSRRGFGSRLIERALASELGGEVSLDYAAAGLECTITAPLPTNETALGKIDDLSAHSMDSNPQDELSVAMPRDGNIPSH